MCQVGAARPYWLTLSKKACAPFESLSLLEIDLQIVKAVCELGSENKA